MAQKLRFTDEDLQAYLDQGLTQAEIAEKCRVSPQAVSSRIKRLKAKFTAKLEGEIIDPAPVNLKDMLTARELKFIENHLVAGLTKEKAMDSAGYANLHPRYK